MSDVENAEPLFVAEAGTDTNNVASAGIESAPLPSPLAATASSGDECDNANTTNGRAKEGRSSGDGVGALHVDERRVFVIFILLSAVLIYVY